MIIVTFYLGLCQETISHSLWNNKTRTTDTAVIGGIFVNAWKQWVDLNTITFGQCIRQTPTTARIQ